MRLMCIDDSGMPELKFGEIYTWEYTYEKPCCKRISYALVEFTRINKEVRPYHKNYICNNCGGTFPITDKNKRQTYKAERFIEIDEYADLVETTADILEPEKELA